MDLYFDNFILVASFIILISVILSKSSDRFGLPILIVFLAIGMLAGSEGVGGISFENYELTHAISLVALCLIIFSGGVETKISEIRENLFRGIVLSTLGVLCTTLIVGFCIKNFTNLSTLESLLIGAVLSATDAAAVFSVFKGRDNQVSSKLQGLLKFESGSNDPMAYLLVSVILGYIEKPHLGVTSQFLTILLNPIVGVVVGIFTARVFIYINNIIRLNHIGLYPALTLSFLFLSYSLSSVLYGNGFLAVYLFGLVISSKQIRHKTLLYSFYDGVGWLAQIGLFVMLGLLVFPSRLINIIPTGLLIAFILMIIARPLTIFLLLSFSKFTFKEKIFISWGGLKGATPIVFASLVAIKLGSKAEPIFDIVFFCVLISAILQGGTLGFVSKKLGLTEDSVTDLEFPIDFELMEKTKKGIQEISVDESFFCIQKRIIDLSLPVGSLILFIKRSGNFIVPDGATQFESQDKILVVTKRKADIDIVLACLKQGYQARENV